MSRVTDVKKMFRSGLFWTEDVLKVEKVLKVPFSGYVRDLLHRDMERYELPEEGKTMLQRAIEAKMARRKAEHPGVRGLHNKRLTIDVVAIPAEVRKSARFVEETK